MMKWNTTLREFLKVQLEPENEFDKFEGAVKKSDFVFGHSSKGTTGRFAKTISFFLRESNENSCKVEVTRNRGSLGDGQELQIPYKLHFTGDSKYIDKLKVSTDIIINISFLFYFLPFSGHKRMEVRINENTFALGTEKIVRISECSNYWRLNYAAQNTKLS